MEKSTDNADFELYVAFRHRVNKTTSVQGFRSNAQFTAKQQADGLMKSPTVSMPMLIEGGISVGEAMEKYRKAIMKGEV